MNYLGKTQMSLSLLMSHLFFFVTTKINSKQECIPVGCVPAARWPYAGVCFPGVGCLLWGGVCSGGLLWGGLLWGGLLWGGSAPRGGVWSQGGLLPGVSAPEGYPSMHWGRHPSCGQTRACKNITLATTSLRPVTNSYDQKKWETHFA